MDPSKESPANRARGSILDVARRTPRFRKLWAAQVVSQAGDWFNRVAVVSLIATLAGESAAVGIGISFALEAAMRLLPTAALSPIAGPLADRLPRRALMIATDLTRIGVVLAMLTVDRPEEVPRLYALIAVQMGLGICFDAARQAALPATVEQSDLHDAIALSSATWSVMLSLGAFIGGLAVQQFGVRTALVFDASTYLVSAACLRGLGTLPQARVAEPFRWLDLVTLADMRRAMHHVRSIGIAPALLTKTLWGPAGAFLVLLSILSATRFGLDPSGERDPARMGWSLGVLLAARGVGTAIGPFVGRRFFGRHGTALLTQIQSGFVLAFVGYAALAFAPTLLSAAACVTLAHIGGGAIWVASTAFWQESVDDRYRGRVHALDFLGMTLSFSLFGLVAGVAFDRGLDSRATTLLACGLLAATATVWMAATRRLRHTS